MDLIRKIVAGAPPLIKDGGALLVEMAEWMGPDVLAMVERTGAFAGSSIGNDLSSRPRFVAARKR
jgi:methylase of polypeptide subunit release factors